MRPPTISWLASALVAITLTAACATAPSTPRAPGATAAAASIGATASPDDGPTPVPTDPLVATAPEQAIPSQTNTDWGRIWDELPVAFPVPPGRSSQVEPDEPASGAYDIDAPVSDVAAGMQAALEQAMFSTESMSGPLEDGSVVIESVGPPDAPECRTRATIAPLGQGSRMTVLYAAACPFPLD